MTLQLTFLEILTLVMLNIFLYYTHPQLLTCSNSVVSMYFSIGVEYSVYPEADRRFYQKPDDVNPRCFQNK